MFKIELFICIKMDLALNNLQWLICHKTKAKQISFFVSNFFNEHETVVGHQYEDYMNKYMNLGLMKVLQNFSTSFLSQCIIGYFSPNNLFTLSCSFFSRSKFGFKYLLAEQSWKKMIFSFLSAIFWTLIFRNTRVSQKFCNILVCSMYIKQPKQLKLWKVVTVVGSIVINCVLTCCTLLHFMWDLKATQLNIQGC